MPGLRGSAPASSTGPRSCNPIDVPCQLQQAWEGFAAPAARTFGQAGAGLQILLGAVVLVAGAFVLSPGLRSSLSTAVKTAAVAAA